MKKLREFRQLRNMSQQTLADLIGVKRGALSMWEIDKAEPDIATIIKICNVLNVSSDELLDISDKKFLPEIEGKVLNNEEIDLIKDFRKCRRIFKTTIKSTITNLLKADFDCRNEYGDSDEK